MAYIGMRYPVAAVVASHTDGSAITYTSPGFEIGPAVSANVTFDTSDNPDYGNDIVIDSDRGINGYSITLEVNSISVTAREKLLGWHPVTGTGSTVTHYEVSDGNPPEVGFGYIREKMSRGTKTIEAFWFHKVRFVSAGENAATKERQINWQHQQVEGAGIGAYLDSTGVAKYFDWNEFSTMSAAKTWLYGRAGVPVPNG